MKFKDAWLSKWNPAILKIAKADKIKIIDEDDTQGMHVDNINCGFIDFIMQAAFQALVKLVVPLRKVKQTPPLKRLVHNVKVNIHTGFYPLNLAKIRPCNCSTFAGTWSQSLSFIK